MKYILLASILALSACHTATGIVEDTTDIIL